jgi:hypothetical protein
MSRIRMHLKGGLGNQLFILAAGLLYSDIRKVNKVVLDTSLLKRDFQRDLALNGLDLPKEVVFSSGALHSLRHKRKVNKILMFLGEKISTEEDFSTHPASANTRCLEGYFQSYRIADLVKAPMIGVLNSISISNTILRIPKDFIAVHLRRGDYLSAATMSVHGIVSSRYVTEGISLIQKSLGNLPVVVFTDSPNIALRELDRYDGEILILGPEEVSAPEVIAFMSKAKGLIISNSTLSWWAAWLATRIPEGNTPIVVRPAKWFAVGIEPKDLLPEEWLSIEN